MNQGAAVPPAAAAAAPDATEDKNAAANDADWSDSADNSNSQDDEFLPPPQGPSLSYERKIRLHKYAENRARSCLSLLADSSNALWKVHDCKNDIGVYKPSSDWSESVSAKAVVFANAAFPNVLKTIYDLKTSDKFKLFMRKVLGDMFLDAEVLEDLNGTGVYPSANPPRDAREMYKQAAIKWWAIKSGTLASKSSDFYVLEESLAEVGGMPHIQGNNLERSQFDALICKFERTSSPDYKDDFITISIAFQRPPPMVSLFRSNHAVEMVTQLARGLRDLLEDPPELQEISVVKTSAWVKDKYVEPPPIFCGGIILMPSFGLLNEHSSPPCLDTESGASACFAIGAFLRSSVGVITAERAASGMELNNQEDFKDWIQRSTEQQQLAVGGEAGGGVQQLRLPSPSHSQDLSGALETPHDEQETVPNPKEDRMPRKYRRISLDNEEEEKEDGNSRPHHQYRERPDTIDDRQRRDSNLRTSRKVSSGTQRQSNTQIPQRHSYGEQAARGSKHMRRVRRSHSEVSVERATGHGRDNQLNATKPIATKSPGRGRPISVGRRGPSQDPVRQSVPPSHDNQKEAERRPDSIQNSSSYVHAASAWATNKTEVLAMTGAFQELMTKLGGDVHFVVVGFSTGFSAEVIVNLLRQLAPGVPYIGGTIARGMCDENAWVSVNRHNDEGLVTLWGVNDPHGIYSVVHAEYSQSDAHEKTYAAAKTAFARVAAEVDAGEKPAFIATYACPLFVEHAIDGIREAIHCPIIGGCSSDATRHGEGEVSVSWIQISSSSSSDYTKSVRDGRGDWTEMGIAFALCFPSVETYVSWFSGYSPVGVNSEYCMGTVTKASNKTIYEIDSKPAAEQDLTLWNVLTLQWLDVASDKSQTELSSIGFPRLGSLHPLGTTIDFVSNQMEIDRSIDANSSSSLCSMQSSDWSKLINMTAVITGINEDGSLSTTSSVASGTNVVLMETSAQSLKTAINKVCIANLQFHTRGVLSDPFVDGPCFLRWERKPRRRSEPKEEPKQQEPKQQEPKADEPNACAAPAAGPPAAEKTEEKSAAPAETQEKKRPAAAAPPLVRTGGATLKKFKFSSISLKTTAIAAPKKKPAPLFNALNGGGKPPLNGENAEKQEQREKQKTIIEEQKKEEKAKFLAEEDAVPKQLALWTPEDEEKGETPEEKKKREEQEARQRERVQKVVEEVDPLDAYMAGLVDEAAINQSRANPAANVISQSEIEAKGKINIYGTFLPPDAAEQSAVAAQNTSSVEPQAGSSGVQETPEEREAREERELKEFMRAIKEKREKEADAAALSSDANGTGPQAEEDPMLKKDDTGRIYQGFEEDIIGEDSELVDQRSALEILQEQQKKKEIKPVDHSKMNYVPFQKKFYVVPKEIKDLSEEDVEAQRKESEIKVRGKNCPRPLQKWTQCGFSVRMLQLIKKHGYEEPFAIQKQALPAIMSGRDVIGIAKTGSGKTLAFLLPMFRHILAQPPLQENEGPIGIIMAPARELAQQIYVEARRFSKGLGLRATAVYGGSSVSEQIANLKRGSDIVICTPGRMIDILCMSAGKMVSLQRVTYVVLDEADRMFDMGFEPQITKIMMNIRPDRQTLLFSATFPRSVESLARKVLRKPVEITVGTRSTASGDITQYVEVREEDDKFMRLLQLLGLWYEKGNILVFVNKQQACDQIFQDLMKAGYPALSLHGGKDQVDRDYTIDDFKRKVRTVMVATSVAGRGLDVKDLVLVINYHCPNHMEDYVHRVGRTGRAGRKGTAYTFISPDEEEYSVDLVKALENAKQTVPPELTTLAEGFKAKVKRGEARYHGSGFKGKGFTFDETERNETQRTADLQRRQYELDQGILVEDNDVADEDDGDDPNKESTSATVDKPSLPAGAKQLPMDSEAMSAFIKAQKIIQNLDLQYKANGDGSGENHFVEELEINDYPQQARWKVTQKEASDAVAELTGVAVIARGSYIPAGRKPNPSERKLYLAIEGPTQASVLEARRELQRILDETTMQVGLGGDKYGKYSL
ncbi:unnamed protein product [Phytophthora fragariaefolia]|uniref:RNA helicase n=1 Tax=Phytophthora fragariaefolia TaxID=1490495 RepID=A0A9W6XLA9_9STRA|nr:unnamed protein product [Phytophthora fragariaefolia]